MSGRVRVLVGAALLVGLSSVSSVGAVEVPPSGCTLTGTPGADWLIGTDRDDVICGLEGDDVIDGRGGNDLIIGGGRDLVADYPGTRFDLGPESRLIDVVSGRVSYGVFEQAAFEAGKLGSSDIPAARANQVTVRDAPLCLSRGDEGRIYRANEAIDEVMAAWDGAGATVRNQESEAVASVLGDLPDSADVLLHRGTEAQTVIRVPDGVDKVGFAQALETALARVPAVVAVELLSLEAALKGDLSETERSAAAGWKRQDELDASELLPPARIEVWERCTDARQQEELRSQTVDAVKAIAAKDGGVWTYSVDMNPFTEQVELRVEVPDFADPARAMFIKLESTLRRALDPKVLIIESSPALDAAGASRFNDGNPHWGGVFIRTMPTGGRCTSGFAMSLHQNLNQRLMSTAGHCASDGGPVTGWEVQSSTRTNQPMGLFGHFAINAFGQTNASNADVSLIGANLVAYDRVILIWMNEGSDWRTVNSRRQYLSGFSGSVCMSGASMDIGQPDPIRCMSAWILTTVTQNNQAGTYPHTESVYRVARCGTDMGVGGDSGSALWVHNSTGAVQVVGLYIGGTVDAQSSVCGGSNRYWGNFLLVSEIETRLNARVETVLGAGVSW